MLVTWYFSWNISTLSTWITAWEWDKSEFSPVASTFKVYLPSVNPPHAYKGDVLAVLASTITSLSGTSTPSESNSEYLLFPFCAVLFP